MLKTNSDPDVGPTTQAMEPEFAKSGTIDPEVRAHIYSLVSAVGGTSADLDGRYVLGDDALACLKDLKKWLNLYDNALNRLDVARCIAEANLVQGDLLEILAQWSEEETDNKLKYKIALACLELLVPLTWPYEPDDTRMTVNHHRHLPYLELAQISYKRSILHYDATKILRTAVRVALPSMAEERSERSTRDEGIIKIVLYFLRNIALISQPQHVPQDEDDAEITRSVTVDAFHYQDVFNFLLTMSSSMGDEFAQQDVMILETLFHLLKGVDATKLFMDKEQLSSTQTEEFKDILRKEKDMLAGYVKHAPTRHNRFGTMIWVKREDEKMSTVSGQNVLGNADATLVKLDKQKKWSRPKAGGRKNADETNADNEFDRIVPLSDSARKHLRGFVEDFLDSSFNPLFTHVRKAIEREAERVLPAHSRQFFYLVSWFLQAECARRESSRQKLAKQAQPLPPSAEDESFGLIASVLNQETFVLLNRYLQRCQDEKSWLDLNAGMKCFTQILLTVQEMQKSPNDEDIEIAENIQNRIFYEQTTHDRIVSILRSFNPNQHKFGYLDACTELVHVFIRMLEQYSKQNVDLQVRTRRRIRKRRQAKAAQQTDASNPGSNDQNDFGNSDDDLQDIQRASSERKFDFNRFVARFCTQPCIDTFVAFLRYYRDLNPTQLKRAHRFFYRVAFKQQQFVVLFRLDIIALFQKMIRGPDPLSQEAGSPKEAFKEWEELVRQVFRRLVKKMTERKEILGTELLFSKIPSTVYFLETGEEREFIKRPPRPPADLEVKPAVEGEEKRMGVAVGILVDQGKADLLKWIRGILGKAIEERKGWEDMEAARKEGEEVAAPADAEENAGKEQPKAPSIAVITETDEQKTALFKDNKLRLLLSLIGFVRLGEEDDPDASWIIPSSLTADQLSTSLDLIRKFEFEPASFDDGKAAIDMVRSKAAGERTAAARHAKGIFSDNDSDGLGDEEFLFPAGGPTNRKSNALEELKKKRRIRTQKTEESDMDDEERDRKAEERRAKRKEAELEKRRKIKSNLFVHDSDEEDDEERDREFFAREEAVRKKTADAVARALMEVRRGAAEENEKGSKKRKARGDKREAHKKKRVDSEKGDESNSEDGFGGSDTASSRSSSVDPGDPMQIDSSDGDGTETDTPNSSQQPIPFEDEDSGEGGPVAKRTDEAETALEAAAGPADDEDEDAMPIKRVVRRTVRAGFVIDSDSDD
ncbi:MAG: Topoisomerase 1-associated factor 1 [Bogoriella megaspora]|nr:MAG: Topoisomerase 1-associated factor 1 [Bogoriella megaspora]